MLKFCVIFNLLSNIYRNVFTDRNAAFRLGCDYRPVHRMFGDIVDRVGGILRSISKFLGKESSTTIIN